MKPRDVPIIIAVVILGGFAALNALRRIAAAWSPDGEWVAMARVDQIIFQRLVGGDALVTWAASANSLVWRR